MEANNILHSDLLDILFENRNKEYGAYELRRKYNKRIALALLITAAIASAVTLTTFISKAFASKSKGEVEVPYVVVREFKNEPLPKTLPPPVKNIPLPQPATSKLTSFLVKKDDEVKEHDVPPVQNIINVSNVTQDGLKEDILPHSSIDNKTGVVEAPKKEVETDEPFLKVEVEAKVDISQWKRWLTNQLQRYIEDAANAGMAPGQYTVQVKFLVEKDGSIADVHALNDPGFSLAKAAEDVVKRGPKWEPGIQNGKKVRSYHTQPITFLISEQ